MRPLAKVSPFDVKDSLARKMPPTPFDHRVSPGLLAPELPAPEGVHRLLRVMGPCNAVHCLVLPTGGCSSCGPVALTCGNTCWGHPGLQPAQLQAQATLLPCCETHQCALCLQSQIDRQPVVCPRRCATWAQPQRRGPACRRALTA